MKSDILQAELLDDAHAFLESRCARPPKFSEAFAEIQKCVGKLDKGSRTAHLEQLAFAYASFLAYRQHPELDEFVADKAKHLKLRLTKRTDALLIMVRLFLSYGVRDRADSTPRKLWSRDANAIRHLMGRGIKPSDVVKVGQVRGEGVDFWSRTHRRPLAAHPEETRATKRTKEGHEVRKSELRQRTESLRPGVELICWIRRQRTNDEIEIKFVEVKDPELPPLLLNLAKHFGNLPKRRAVGGGFHIPILTQKP